MSGARVMVVDDNRELAENLVEVLHLAGVEADCFDSPASALGAVSPGLYQVVIVDLRMPQTDGIELYRQLRKIDPTLRGIAMSAFTRDEQVSDALRAGISRVMCKPIDPIDLLSFVHTLAAV